MGPGSETWYLHARGTQFQELGQPGRLLQEPGSSYLGSPDDSFGAGRRLLGPFNANEPSIGFAEGYHAEGSVTYSCWHPAQVQFRMELFANGTLVAQGEANHLFVGAFVPAVIIDTLTIPMQSVAPIPTGALLSLNLWHDGCSAMAMGSGQYASSITLDGLSPGSRPPVSPTNQTSRLPANSIAFDECVSWSASLTFGAGPVMPPGRVPPGWEPGPTDPGSAGIRGVDCKKLSVGPFEGPARLVWELNAHIVRPSDCVGEPFSEWGLLNGLYLEDPELAAYLNDTYGMPVFVSKINDTTRPLGAAKLHTVTWGPHGMAPSTLSFWEDASTPDGPLPMDLYWQKGTGIVVLRAMTNSNGSLFGPRQAVGMMEPPMLLADFLGGNFTGSAEWYPTFQADGEFLVFSDLQCAQQGNNGNPPTWELGD
jgi:hypothetical protein